VNVAAVAEAYSRTGAAWDRGPHRVYRRLAEVLVGRVPGGVAARDVLDVGAGTGAAGRAALAHGARRVFALDISDGQLRAVGEHRPPAVVADARRLPYGDASLDVWLAAFSLNHVPDPTRALGEAARVLRSGGGLAASAYALDDTHPAKQAVEQACTDAGWRPPDWYLAVQREAIPLLATADRALAVAAPVLTDVRAESIQVPLPELSATDLVAWRMGMAQFAPFLATLDDHRRQDVAEAALGLLPDDVPPLVRSIVVLTWRKP
jgi:ubiquinone/menaquinone biosynthesis C-methylase UbiE